MLLFNDITNMNLNFIKSFDGNNMVTEFERQNFERTRTKSQPDKGRPLIYF